MVYPVYKGSFERWDPFINLQGEEYLRTFRTRMFEWRQDLGRVIDVVSARADIDATRIAAYYGSSFGASTAFPLIALEERLKAAILAPAGFTYRELPPEADAINYVFERLGTPAEHKRQVIFEAGHGNFPRSEMIREVLAWLDRYLEPVATAKPTP